MEAEMTKRVLQVAKLMIEKKGTVREIAKIVGISKSTVHKDLTERLPYIDKDLSDEIKELLEYNKIIRHIRGGLSTKLKYQIKKEYQS